MQISVSIEPFLHAGKDDLKQYALSHSKYLLDLYNTNMDYRADLDFSFNIDKFGIVPEEENPYIFVLKK